MKGRSGGHNKKSLERHVLEGTWRAGRHGPRPKKSSEKVQEGFEATSSGEKAPILFAVPPPEFLSKAERAIWRSVDPREFSPLELALLELFSVHLAKHRALRRGLQTAHVVRTVRQEAAFVKALADALGPAWRRRPAMRPATDPKDEWYEFDHPEPHRSTEIH